MNDNNHVKYTGAIATPPEFREFTRSKVTSFYLAVPSSSDRKPPGHIRCNAWNNLAEQCRDLKVGQYVSIEAEFESDAFVSNTSGKTIPNIALRVFDVTISDRVDGTTF